MGALGGRARDRVANELRAGGVEVLFGERVTAFEGAGGRVARALTESGRAFEADVVSIGVGVRPEVALAVAAGIEVGESGAVRTDERQRTSAPGVYAAGDCCEALNSVSGRRVWHPLGQPAVRQGWVAGANAAGRDFSPEARYTGVVSTNAVKVFRLEVARTGLSVEEALEAGFDASEVESESHTRAALFLVAFCLVAFLPGFFQIPPVDRDEARFAQATKQMVESGDYVDIRFQSEVRYKKPVGIYWLQAGAVKLGEKLGVPQAHTTIWLYRIPSLLGAIGSVLLTYWAALAFASRRAAVLAAVMMAASIQSQSAALSR
jgi:hypothetical protein